MPGTSISQIEVLNVDRQGLWLLVEGKEYFLSHKDFPWFKESKLADVLNIELYSGGHIYWPALDVDLSTAILENPARYPLKSSKNSAVAFALRLHYCNGCGISPKNKSQKKQAYR